MKTTPIGSKLFILLIAGVSILLSVSAGSLVALQTEGTEWMTPDYSLWPDLPDDEDANEESDGIIRAGESEWATPINLSQSGAASDVVVAEDSAGFIHVIWLDAVAGFVYSRSEDEGWRAPVTIEVPFIAELTSSEEDAGVVAELFVPHLRADANGRIHAFWTNEEATLLHSAVPTDAFTTLSAWSDAQTLAEGVLALGSAVDEQGNLHLTYIQSADTEEFPSGVYYRRSDDGGASWTPDALLDQSAYFRSLPPEKVNILIATAAMGEGERGRVYVAWDVAPREKLFLAQSNDNGENWRIPREIDRRNLEDSQTAVGPSNLILAADGSEVHLIWQAGHDGEICRQYHQWSKDGGHSWEPLRPMLPHLLVCPDFNHFLVGQNGRIFLLTTLQGNVQTGVYLSAWNGLGWSEPQEQGPLSEFINPETLRPVSFDCRQELLAAGQLIAIGCSAGESQDVWLLQRPLGTLDVWFPAASAWELSPVLATSANEIVSPLIVSDADGWVHLLWSERNRGVISYARWDGSRWSRPLPILNSPTGVVDGLVTAVTPDRRLLVMWSDNVAGQIYFSQTQTGRASFAEDWVTPQLLPGPQDVTSPDMLVDAAGVIYVVFAVPVNEERGIYLTRSDDLGENWSEPVQVFDAVAHEWAVVDSPQLSVTDNGQLHLLWTRYSAPPTAHPQALVYARSDSGGERWSEPGVVAQSSLLWSQITGAGENKVHRHWQERVDNRATLWHEVTLDGGLTWSYTSQATASSMAAVNGANALGLSNDISGRLHLVYEEALTLHYRLWDGVRWLEDESLVLQGRGFALPDGVPLPGRTRLSKLYSLDMAVTSDQRLAVVYVALAVQDKSEDDNEPLYLLQFAHRPLEIPDPMPVSEAIAASALIPSPTPTMTPSPTPTAVPATHHIREEIPPQVNQVTTEVIAAAALGPAGIFVILIFLLGRHRKRV